MHDDPILLFLIQVLVVLALARFLGEVFRKFKQPPLAGEILAGVLLGQTVLGNLAPGLFHSLFPHEELSLAMYGVVSEIGILFLLLVVGLEVHVGSAWKMRNQTFTVAVMGVMVPLVLGSGVAWLAYDQWVEVPTPRLAFALLVGAGVSITAITVVARLLFDLKIIKSDLGLFLISAMALNELLGWVVLAVVLGLVNAGSAGGGIDFTSLGGTMAGVLGFAAFALTVGRHLTTSALVWMRRVGLPSPATPLSFVVCIGLAGGAITGALGVHPVFGFLLAGMMAGDPEALSEHTRSIIGQMVESIFVPLFFAGICLHVDFASTFNLVLVLAVTALSIGGKFVGAWLGTLMVTMPSEDRLPVAIAHVPGGPMGVLLASVAMEAEVIGPRMFVALVIASILSALVVGPLFTWRLHKNESGDVIGHFARNRFHFDLDVETREDAIQLLAAVAADATPSFDADEVREAVRIREGTWGTGIGNGIAVPHARLPDLAQPIVAVGVSKQGIEWDAVDDRPVHLVFAILTSDTEHDFQLEILSQIARSFREPEAVRQLVDASDVEVAWARMRAALLGQ